MHQLAHNNIRLKKCDVCGQEFMSGSHLKRHQRVHTGEKPFACPVCGQGFAQRYNMTAHLKAHQGIHRSRPKSHVCEICLESFYKIDKLNAHLAEVHGGSDNVMTKNTSINSDDCVKLESVILC